MPFVVIAEWTPLGAGCSGYHVVGCETTLVACRSLVRQYMNTAPETDLPCPERFAVWDTTATDEPMYFDLSGELETPEFDDSDCSPSGPIG
jgi:hypothetical protein